MNHNQWMTHMIQKGWVWGEEVDEELKKHPALVDWDAVMDLYKVNDLIFLAIANKHRPNAD
jgi:hypothetical protein